MKKILVVEDNTDSREVIALFITKMGYQVTNAKDNHEAITFAETEGPDLIFMDMDLPDADEITKILKQNPNTSHIPVVGVTAWEVGTVARENLESRYCHLLNKAAVSTVAHPKGDTILALAFCIALFLGFAFVTHSRAERHYIYQGRDGGLVISNREPPPGSIIIEEQTLSDSAFPRAQESGEPQLSRQAEGSPEPSETK